MIDNEVRAILEIEANIIQMQVIRAHIQERVGANEGHERWRERYRSKR